jgi:hypothetical protein
MKAQNFSAAQGSPNRPDAKSFIAQSVYDPSCSHCMPADSHDASSTGQSLDRPGRRHTHTHQSKLVNPVSNMTKHTRLFLTIISRQENLTKILRDRDFNNGRINRYLDEGINLAKILISTRTRRCSSRRREW